MNKSVVLLCALLCTPCLATSISHGRFQDVGIVRPEGEPKRVVLLMSGGARPDESLHTLAEQLAAAGALVAEIDSVSLNAELERDEADCVYPAGDLDNLSHVVEAYARVVDYQAPVLVGRGSAGHFVQAMLAQAPAGTFAGGITLGWCPESRLKKPLCKNPQPSQELPVPWTVITSPGTDSCATARTSQRVQAAGGVVINTSERDIDRVLLLELARMFTQKESDQSRSESELRDLPLIEIPASAQSTTLALIVSGDGGWASIDKALAAAFHERDIAVAGLDSLSYFWVRRTPQSTANDIERILRHYLRAWHVRDSVLIGYSQGADVLPFIINRLSDATRSHVRLVAMLSPGTRAQFEFHLSNWLSDSDAGLPIAPELKSVHASSVLCIYGEEDVQSICTRPLDGVHVLELPGGHHFGGNYPRLAELILRYANDSASQRPR